MPGMPPKLVAGGHLDQEVQRDAAAGSEGFVQTDLADAYISPPCRIRKNTTQPMRIWRWS